MPTTKSDGGTPTSRPTREYKVARQAARSSSRVSRDEARLQILLNGPKPSETVSYSAVQKNGVTFLKRSVKS